jgi:hypothetical protein
MTNEQKLKKQGQRENEIQHFELVRKSNPHILKCVYVRNQYHPFDLKINSGGTYVAGEIKVRKYTLEFFLKNPPYIELLKLYQMKMKQETIKFMKGIDVKLMYFNFTSDGYLMVYELAGDFFRDFKWEKKLLPVDDFTDEKVFKLVAELEHPIEIIKLN